MSITPNYTKPLGVTTAAATYTIPACGWCCITNDGTADVTLTWVTGYAYTLKTKETLNLPPRNMYSECAIANPNLCSIRILYGS